MAKGSPHILSGICPNPSCQKQLFFPEHGVSVECSGCGQRHFQSRLKSVEKQSQPGLIDLLESLLFQLKKNFDKETHKVNELSNYQCTLISPLMTYYGMDKSSGKARLLTEMGKSSEFDCGQLCDRAFLIDPDHLNVNGYGRDRTGSDVYLEDTLNVIKTFNDGEERLVPIHADGDGHCLVHSLSRALVGWELFWHPLRVNLKQHFVAHLAKYKMLFRDFIQDSEWPCIINECDPEFLPVGTEPTGLRNIHIFGLANVLRRPIILLDSIAGIKSPGDYSAIFLPYFSSPAACKNKEGVLNKPLCIAWSNQGRNHFIPLVGVRGKKCPVLSRHIIQRAWGVSDIEIDKYVDFQDGTCQIGGEKPLQIGYIQRLAKAMGEIFFKQHGIAASLVADMYLHIFKPNGLVFGVNMDMLLEKTKESVFENQLFICMSCRQLTLSESVDDAWLLPGGKLYDIAVITHKTLKDGYTYTFPMHDVVATYNAALNKLVPDKKIRKPSSCPCCSHVLFRQVKADYSIAYENGDCTLTQSNTSKSGYKHYWYGKEYSTTPKSVKVMMEWKGAVVVETVPWFQDEDDSSLNSNVYQVAQELVQSKFPGEFGSERLVQKVVDQILYQTSDPVRSQALPAYQHFGDREESAHCFTSLLNQASNSQTEGASGFTSSEPSDNLPDGGWSPDQASKAIITGRQSQSIHREELTKSKTETEIKQRIEQNATKQQNRLTDMKSRNQNKKRSESTSGLSNQKAENTKSRLPTSLSAPSISSSLAQSYGANTTSSSAASSPTTEDGIKKTTTDAVSTSKRIRLCISDGRNITLELSAQCTFSELQKLIGKHMNAPLHKQRILHGFPPTELKPPPAGQEDYVIPIRSGEKIMVDIIPDVKQEPEDFPVNKMPQVHACPPNRDGHTTNSFGAGKDNEVRDALLHELLKSPVHAGTNSVDEAVKLLKCTAALGNKDFWTYAQRFPHLFSVNGMFYDQVARDLGLEHGKHCTITSFEHKLFVYNKYDDRLELCLEPHGHFPIENNVEMNAHLLMPSSKCGLKAGQRPFSGQGHSLRSSSGQEDRMPTDIPMSPKRSEARPLNLYCDPNCHQDSIEEEDEEEVEGEGEMLDRKSLEGSPAFSHQLRPHELTRNFPTVGSIGGARQPGQGTKLVRKGPGYSELSPIPENLTNERSEGLHELVSRIEQAVETMGKEADRIGGTMPASLASPRMTTPSKLVASHSPESETASASYGSTHSSQVESSDEWRIFDSESETASYAPLSLLSPSSRAAAIGSEPNSGPEGANLSSRPSPRQDPVDHQGDSAGHCSSVVSNDRIDLKQMDNDMEVTLSNAIAAYAEKIASDIAAMDGESREVTDCMSKEKKFDEGEQRMEDDENMREVVKCDESGCVESASETCTETPMITEPKE